MEMGNPLTKDVNHIVIQSKYQQKHTKCAQFVLKAFNSSSSRCLNQSLYYNESLISLHFIHRARVCTLIADKIHSKNLFGLLYKPKMVSTLTRRKEERNSMAAVLASLLF